MPNTLATSRRTSPEIPAGDGAGTRVWWIGKRASDALCFRDAVNFEFLFCPYGGSDMPLLQDRLGASVCTLNNRFVPRHENQEGFVESILERLAPARLAESRGSAVPGIIVPYRTFGPIERFASAHGMLVAGTRAHIVDTMNDNLFLRRAFLEAGILQPRSITARIGHQRFGPAVEQLGLPFYLKRQYSSSGSGCFRIGTEQDHAGLQRTLDPEEEVLLSALVPGPSLNLHGVITDDAVSVRTPSVQIVGVPEACDVSTWYCGNDFAALRLVARETTGRAIDVTRQVGEWMRQAGYRGFFGLDVIGDARTMCVLDFNPRMQGSTFLLHDLELANGIEPASRLHLSAFGVVEPAVGAANPIIPLNDSRLGSHLILRSRRKKTATVTRTIAPGIYTVSHDGALLFRRPGLTVNDCEEPPEFVVTCSVPYEGSKIGYGAPLCKVVTAQAILDPASGRLNVTGRRMAAAVRRSIVLG